jgi:hypothetical protein
VSFTDEEKKRMTEIAKEFGFEITFDDGLEGIYVNDEKIEMDEIFPDFFGTTLHLSQKDVEITYKAYCTLAALSQDNKIKNKCIELANKLIQE